MKIALTLREARLAAGLSQRELGEYLEMSQDMVARLENGQRPFHDRYVQLLPDAVRGPVAAALIEEHEEIIRRLR